MGRRGLMLASVALVLIVLAIRHPSADLHILAHDRGDPSPQRIEAALDLGLMALSLVVTWSRGRLTG